MGSINPLLSPIPFLTEEVTIKMNHTKPCPDSFPKPLIHVILLHFSTLFTPPALFREGCCTVIALVASLGRITRRDIILSGYCIVLLGITLYSHSTVSNNLSLRV